MAYTRAATVQLGSAYSGSTVTAQIVDSDGVNVGVAQAMTERGTTGLFVGALTIADDQRGGIVFLADDVDLGVGVALNPEARDARTEMDDNSTKLANLDAAVTSRLASADYVAPTGGSYGVR